MPLPQRKPGHWDQLLRKFWHRSAAHATQLHHCRNRGPGPDVMPWWRWPTEAQWKWMLSSQRSSLQVHRIYRDQDTSEWPERFKGEENYSPRYGRTCWTDFPWISIDACLACLPTNCHNLPRNNSRESVPIAMTGSSAGPTVTLDQSVSRSNPEANETAS